MTELDIAVFINFIREKGRPVHINTLTEHAAQMLMEAKAQRRHYAPGERYAVGEVIYFRDRCVTVASVQEAKNSAQGSFSILSLALPDGTECLMAAGIPDAPADDQQQSVTQDLGEKMLCQQKAETRNRVRTLLTADPRLVSSETLQGEFWCLDGIVPPVKENELRFVEKVLSKGLEDGEPVSFTTDELVQSMWSLEDDGGHEYALRAFALRRSLEQFEKVIDLGDRWASARAWKAFTERPPLEVPRVSSQVVIPEGIATTETVETDREPCQEEVEEGASEEPDENLVTWRQDRPTDAIFILRARHYHNGWLPLSKSVRSVFPPLSSEKQEVRFHHHFGDEPESFRAWIDRREGRIWVSRGMYETFRSYGIYPGARLRISARNEREFDLATRRTRKSEPIRVWRMGLNEDGEIEYEDFEEPRRYEIDDDVYVADVRFEDREALLRQAEEVGNSIFGLMYEQSVDWWEKNERKDLIVTADQLYEAIHFDERGRMHSKATINWELWKRLAFKSLGGGRYLFQPEFEEKVHSADPRRRVERHAEGPHTSMATSDASTAEREYSDQTLTTDSVSSDPILESSGQPLLGDHSVAENADSNRIQPTEIRDVSSDTQEANGSDLQNTIYTGVRQVWKIVEWVKGFYKVVLHLGGISRKDKN